MHERHSKNREIRSFVSDVSIFLLGNRWAAGPERMISVNVSYLHYGLTQGVQIEARLETVQSTFSVE